MHFQGNAPSLPPMSSSPTAAVRRSRRIFHGTTRRHNFAVSDCLEFLQEIRLIRGEPSPCAGLHFQRSPHDRGNLSAFSRAPRSTGVDSGKFSTFGLLAAVTLTAQSAEQLFVPRGFAHGYCTRYDTEIASGLQRLRTRSGRGPSFLINRWRRLPVCRRRSEPVGQGSAPCLVHEFSRASSNERPFRPALSVRRGRFHRIVVGGPHSHTPHEAG